MIELYYSSIIAVLCYFTSYVFDGWLGHGQIFHFYYKWLMKIGKVQLDEDGEVMDGYKQFIKPLGFCKTCANVWLTMAVFGVFTLFIFPLPILFIIPTIFTSNWLIQRF